MNKIRIFLVACLVVILCACKPSAGELRIGTISGPETELMQVAQQVAKDRYNLNIQIVEFSNYVQPNTALEDGDIDANMFQHLPYLEEQIKSGRLNKHKLVVVAKTFLYPMGLYSLKLKTIAQVPVGAKIAIPNDLSNERRALLLLQQAGLISLKAGGSTVQDIQNNPKQIQIQELDAAALPRALPDVDLAAINTNYAKVANLQENRVVYRENIDSPYANLIVVREEDENNPDVQKLVAAFQSPEVIAKAEELFGPDAIPAWKN